MPPWEERRGEERCVLTRTLCVCTPSCIFFARISSLSWELTAPQSPSYSAFFVDDVCEVVPPKLRFGLIQLPSSCSGWWKHIGSLTHCLAILLFLTFACNTRSTLRPLWAQTGTLVRSWVRCRCRSYGSSRESRQTQIKPEIKVYLTDKTYD